MCKTQRAGGGGSKNSILREFFLGRYGYMWIRGGRNKLLERIEALERAVEGQKSAWRLLQLEWEAVFDKLNRTMGRLNARIRKSGSTSEPESPSEDRSDTPAPPPQGVGTHGTLVEMRRNRGVLPR